MNRQTNIEKLIAIYKKSGLSISKFASIIQKDRRTLTAWIDNKSNKNIGEETKDIVCAFFHYPKKIWEEETSEDEFIKLLTNIPEEEVKIIDKGYLGGLLYKLEKEKDGRLVVNSQFPGAVYRDGIASEKESLQNEEIAKFQARRKTLMLSYDYQTIEWYSIKSLLHFCFSEIGNFYTKEQKLQVLELMIKTFEGNYNKAIYFYDSYSRRIYGYDAVYTSMQLKHGSMFFKAPLESVFLEIKNAKLIRQIHRYFTIGDEAPNHINPTVSIQIMHILKDMIKLNAGLKKSYEAINEKTDFGALFFNNISVDLQKKLTSPKVI